MTRAGDNSVGVLTFSGIGYRHVSLRVELTKLRISVSLINKDHFIDSLDHGTTHWATQDLYSQKYAEKENLFQEDSLYQRASRKRHVGESRKTGWL